MFIAQNRFRIASGFAADFERVWRDRESFLSGQPGFLRFWLLKQRALALPGRPAETSDAVEFISHSQWLDESSFLGWMTGEAAKAAHRGSSVPREAYLGPPEFRAYTVALDEVPGGRSDSRSVHQDLVVERLMAFEGPGQREVTRRSREAELPPISIGPFEGRLLEILLRSINARRGIEIGTLGGYSSSWIARALPTDGQLLTLELEAPRAELARKNFAALGVSDRVEVRVGPALDTLAQLGDEWRDLDFVFIDADKANYGHYVRWALPRLRKGGLVLLDNAYLWGALNYLERGYPEGTDREGLSATKTAFEGMADAWKQIALHPDFASIVLPTGEGLAVGIKV